MINLNPVELERLKLLLSELYSRKPSAILPKRILTSEEKISTLDMLRSRFPDLFAGLTEKNLKDNNFLIKFLSNPLNRNKIRNTVLNKLPPAQQTDLAKTLEEASIESGGQEALPAKQEAQPTSHPVEQVPPPYSPDSTVQLPSIPTMGATGSSPVFRNIPSASPPEERESAVNPGLRFQTDPGITLKTLGSKAGIFARTNLDRIARGIVGPGLTNTANFLGRAGNEAINAFARLSNQASRIGSSTRGLSGPSGKLGGRIALAVFLAMFLFVLISSLGVAIPGTTTPTGEASPIGTGCPDTSTNKNDTACHYLNPSIDIFDTQVSGDSYIQKYKDSFIGKQLNDGSTGSEDEFKRRVSAIITKAQSVGINPALVLGFWKSESAFSTVGRPGNDLGCRPNNSEITTFDEDLLCAVGLRSEGKSYEPSITVRCATSKDANSSSCLLLKGIRSNPISDKSFDGTQPLDTTNPIKYPLATFDDFMEAYGPYRHLNDQRLHTNCTHTYNTILEVSKEVGMCKTTSNPITGGGGAPTICSGTPVSFSNVDKKFLPLPTENAACARSVTGACGRPGTCVQNPTRIVLHTTGGGASAIDVYNYFANSPDGRGVGSHFIIGKDGTTIQAVEMLEGKVEVAYAVADYSDHISIEIVHSSIYKDKGEIPAAQYQAIINLVKQLMKTYNIPNGKLDYEWFSTEKGQNPAAIPGLYGHYQLNPATLYGKDGRADPGIGLQRDVKNELK